ncbi:MAG: DegT/DnrJ/EryC1/StrS family aminotransferase [Chthoniobacterales bacterium]
MIELNEFKRQWAEIGPAAMRAIDRVAASGWYILGKEVDNFEHKLAEFWGISHAVGVGNGMDAIEIGLRCLDLQPGQKVLTTPFSAFATTLAIIRAGGVPVFVDVDDNGNIDLEQSGEALARDNSIRFFVPVHLYGNPLDLENLERLKADFNLRVVEDCAQAIGATFGGRAVGTVGQAAATSFYPTKNLGALGDGGAFLTNDGELAHRARALRNYGQSSLYVHDIPGLNSRLDELHAAILADAMLVNLERWTEVRRTIAARYSTVFKSCALRRLQPAATAEPVWHLFPIIVDGAARDRLATTLLSAGIRTGIHYPRILPDQAAIGRLAPGQVVFEPTNARLLADAELSLPIHPFLTNGEVARVASTTHSILTGADDAVVAELQPAATSHPA